MMNCIARADVLTALAAADYHRSKAAKLLNCHPATLYRCMRQYRISVPKSNRTVPDSDLQLMVELRRAGLSFGKISQKFGMPKGSVHYAVENRGMAIFSR